jgi:hypothetical protein
MDNYFLKHRIIAIKVLHMLINFFKVELKHSYFHNVKSAESEEWLTIS